MLRLNRRQIITEHLQNHGSLRVSEAVDLLRVSPATVRRDFALLTEEGLAERAHGGIGAGPRLRMKGWIPPYQMRQMEQVAEKRRLAQAAAQLLKAGDAVFIDGGTTMLHLASFLPAGVRVITNSVILASALDEVASSERPLEVYLAGGFIYPRSGILVGPHAIETIRHYHATWAFLSVGGVDPEGITNTQEQVVYLQQAMIANSDASVVLADHTKIGRKALVHMCPLSDVDLLLTTEEAPAETLQAIMSAGLKCQTV